MSDDIDCDPESVSSSLSEMNESTSSSSPLPSVTSDSDSDSGQSLLSSGSSTPYVGRKRARREVSWKTKHALDQSQSLTPDQHALNANDSESPQRQRRRYEVTAISDAENTFSSSSPFAIESGESAYDRDRLEGLKEYVFRRCSVKEAELMRLRHILRVLTRTVASRDDCNALISTDVVQARFSYHQLETYAKIRCGVEAVSVPMCPNDHMAQTGSFEDNPNCMSPICGQSFSPSYKFWFAHPSDQLRAMCLETDSFRELFDGCSRAQRAVREELSSTMYDYYDGKLFRDRFGVTINTWDSDKELYVFLTLSTDGVEVFKGKDGERSCWPVMFTVLNLGNDHRFRASNALLSAFLPGGHDGAFFDTFLHRIVENLEALEEGFEVLCADGKVRTLRGFVLFCTADWPAATKLSGYAGHNASRPCRYCLRRTENRVLVPLGNTRMLRKALEDNASFSGWSECECPMTRTNCSILETWRLLNEPNNSGRSYATITKSSGIKRRPIISRLSMDFASAFPYDAMHLLLQGWVRLLIVLLCGMHTKTVALGSPFVIDARKLDEINSALEGAAVGFPAAWGRPPPRLDKFSAYKAETLKSFAIFYACVFFNVSAVDRKVVELWVATRDVLLIAFDPTPSSEDITRLQLLVQRSHALFASVFNVNKAHHFCFTPTTHAILHLPEILNSCGSMVNVSQFLAERVMGEVKKHAMSRVRPEANLFHKSQLLFGLRMLEGGLHRVAPPKQVAGSASAASSAERDSFNGWKCMGKGQVKQSAAIDATVMDFLQRQYAGNDVFLISVVEFGRARCLLDGAVIEIETSQSFTKRRRREMRARQKCWIAAEFAIEGLHESQDSNSEMAQVYYGRVMRICEVEFGTQHPPEPQRVTLVEIEWQNGLSVEHRTGVVSAKLNGRRRRGTLIDVTKSLELISCIKRSIAYLDYHGKRSFFDLQHSTTYLREGKLLKGIHK